MWGLRDFFRPAADSLWALMRRSSARPHLHLCNILWSLWLLATVFFSKVEPAYWWSLALGYPVFVLLFTLAHVRPMSELRFYADMMALVAFVSMLWNPAAWTYAVFASVYTGISCMHEPRTGVARIAMIQAILLVLAWWLEWPWFVMLMAVAISVSSGLGAMIGFMTGVRNLELRQSHDEIRRLAAARERERIGRDLHDLLGHTLSLITLKLELSRKLLDRDPEAARSELADAERVARQALAEVRAAVTGIRASDIAAELASARLLLESAGVSLQVSEPLPELAAEVERVLALVVREAATNIARHAGATHAEIDLDLRGDELLLSVQDNGRGGANGRGNGLAGIRDRVRALDGNLRVDSPRRQGTRLEIRIPDAAAGRPVPAALEPRQDRGPVPPEASGLEAGATP